MSRGFDEYEKYIFVGGLRMDLAADKLKSHIKGLFECINISVKKSNIQIIKNPKSDNCYGFVNLEDVDTVKYVLHHHLSTQANRDNLRFDFSTIQDQNKRLKFDYKKPPKQLSPSVSGLPERCYRLKEHRGNETRTLEFKEGIYVLQENVGKYVCAFLNTDGGTLLVGVDNYGQVVGVTCNQQEEDRHRLSIDQAIKRISPSVLPALYTVQFVPVLDKNNSLASNLKVIEVNVKATDDHGDLYLYQGDAFIRRDGSLQMLKTRDVQEWERKRLQQSQEDKEEVLDKLAENTEQLQLLQQHVAKMECEQDNKQNKKKTKVCSVI